MLMVMQFTGETRGGRRIARLLAHNLSRVASAEATKGRTFSTRAIEQTIPHSGRQDTDDCEACRAIIERKGYVFCRGEGSAG